jgi:hypothetical protein
MQTIVICWIKREGRYPVFAWRSGGDGELSLVVGEQEKKDIPLEGRSGSNVNHH